MQDGLLAFINRLSQATCVEKAWQATVDHFRAEGLPFVSYGYKEQPLNGDLLDALSNLPPRIQADWRKDRLYARDPTIGHVTQSMAPRSFGFDQIEATCADDAVVGYYRRLSRAGARSAYVIALRCIVRNAPGYFVLAGPQHATELEHLLETSAHRLALAAFYADLRLQMLFHQQMLASVRLSPREKECLELLSTGLKNDRIAAKLGVSEVTVRLHFTNARKKLRTSTREQAVARAAMLGLIAPDAAA